MQKKLLPSYIPPRVVRALQGWFILWYEQNPSSGELERFRKTFGLNRIPNKATRAERARAIIQDITRQLASGGYIYGGHQAAGQPFTPVSQALDLALNLKMQSDSRDTRNSYRSTGQIFRSWMDREKLSAWPVVRFSKREAMAFLDYVRLQRRVGERTYNNYLISLSALFNELKAREYIQVNPFEQIKKLRPPKKNRRNLSLEERRAMAAWISREDTGLFRAVLLSYYCFLRPNEIRQMQLYCIDLAGKMIRLPAGITKSKIDRAVTLPKSIIPYFQPILDAYPQDWYMFGKNLLPGRTPAGKNTFNRANRKALEALFGAGAIQTINGLSFYSWKDSGLTDLSENLSILELMKQAGHHDPKITMRYIHDRPAKNIQRIKRKIF